jgi:hypothetical protein
MKRNHTLLFLLLLLLNVSLFAQGADSVIQKSDKPQRAAFQGAWLIDNVTGVLNPKKTLQFDIQHRFGVIKSGNKDLVGIWGPSNIRIALAYSISNNVTLGFGTTKDYRLQDLNIKVGLLRQTRSGKIPVSLTFYGNTTIDARESSFFPKSSDRFSYFSQLLIMRRFNQSISLQVAPSFSHYNMVGPSQSNNLFSVAVGGKANISETTAILIDYNQPLGEFSNNPGLALGIEMATSAHIFQVFVGNYNRIVPQANYFLNENKLSQKEFLIGFNINRLWNF